MKNKLKDVKKNINHFQMYQPILTIDLQLNLIPLVKFRTKWNAPLKGLMLFWN